MATMRRKKDTDADVDGPVIAAMKSESWYRDRIAIQEARKFRAISPVALALLAWLLAGVYDRHLLFFPLFLAGQASTAGITEGTGLSNIEQIIGTTGLFTCAFAWVLLLFLLVLWKCWEFRKCTKDPSLSRAWRLLESFDMPALQVEQRVREAVLSQGKVVPGSEDSWIQTDRWFVATNDSGYVVWPRSCQTEIHFESLPFGRGNVAVDVSIKVDGSPRFRLEHLAQVDAKAMEQHFQGSTDVSLKFAKDL